MSDLISLADVIAILEDEMLGHYYLSKKTQIVTKLRDLPAYEVGVKPLEWAEPCQQNNHCHIARSIFGDYYVHIDGGRHQAWLEAHVKPYENMIAQLETEMQAAKAAAQADYAARIRSTLTATPATVASRAQDATHGLESCMSQDVAGLAEDLGLLLDAYKAVLVLYRVIDKHGLTAGALAAKNIADRIVAAHPEFPALCALRGAAHARMKETNK